MSAEEYWTREFLPIAREWRTVSLELRCSDIERAAAGIRLKASQAGGSEPRGKPGAHMGPDYPRGDPALALRFHLPRSDQTASIARNLFEDCDLERFLIFDGPNEWNLGEIKARIEGLSRELEGGQEALLKLPITKIVMEAKLNRLAKALEAASPEKAFDVIYIGLRQMPPPDGGPSDESDPKSHRPTPGR